MAGDIKIDEFLLPHGDDSVPVLHDYGPRLRIGLSKPSLTSVAMFEAASQEMGEESLSERLGGKAYAHRDSPEFLKAKRERIYKGRLWGEQKSGGPLAPAIPLSEEAPYGLSDRLAGRIAVGLILVSGPTKDLELNDTEQLKIAAEVQNGLTWLGHQSPAKDVIWAQHFEFVTVDVPNTLDGASYEDFEAPWRDAVLNKLGVGVGMHGVQDYIQKLKDDLKADRAYCAFFTKYKLWHFAYANLSGPRLVMHYENDGWGVDNIDRVFAHETGHIFGAPDEYAASGCNCGGSYGPDGVPNGNCANCAPNGGVPCIMRANEWDMCKFTLRHLGYTGV